MNNKKISDLRINKEQQSLEKEPHQHALVTRYDRLNFHFCLFGMLEDFEGGFYHGVIELPEDYPFAPPKIKFLTQNGRFQVDKPICTTFTNYHKETWSSAWSIRTILTGLMSFMYTNERGIAALFDSASRRKSLAQKSLANNLANPLFVQLFKEKLIARKIVSETEVQQLIKRAAEKEAKRHKHIKQKVTVEDKQEVQPQESDQKMPALEIVGSGTEMKVSQPKVTVEQKLEGNEPRKRLHFQEDEAESPAMIGRQTQQEEERDLQ